MEKRVIGGTDLACSPIGFGTWQLGSSKDFKYGDLPEEDNVQRAVHAAIDNGINLFDTAEVYGPFLSEEMLARALGSRRKDIILVNKVGYDYDVDGSITGLRADRDWIIERTEKCLKRMNTEWIDLLCIHWRDFGTDAEETISALESLKEQGKIRHYGVSNFDKEMLAEWDGHGEISVTQQGYHLYDRRAEAEIIPYCREHQKGFIAYGALAYGILSGTMHSETKFAPNDWRGTRANVFGVPLFDSEVFQKEIRANDKLTEFARDNGKTLPQLAISWVVSNPQVSSALVGMLDVEQLQENIQAASWKLSENDLQMIDQVLSDEGISTYLDVPIQVKEG